VTVEPSGRVAGLDRSFHLRWKQVPDPTHHSRKWAFSLLDTGFRHGLRGPTHESNHKADRFANACVLITWTLFENEFWPNRFKRLGIQACRSENFSLVFLRSDSKTEKGQEDAQGDPSAKRSVRGGGTADGSIASLEEPDAAVAPGNADRGFHGGGRGGGL
jgi:hypothetical protein